MCHWRVWDSCSYWLVLQDPHVKLQFEELFNDFSMVTYMVTNGGLITHALQWTNAAVLNPLPHFTLFLAPPAETSKVDYVLFQAATAVMESVVREWILLEKTSIESLRAFLLTYVLQRPK